MSVRTGIILLNVAFAALLIGFVAFRVLRLRANPDEATPQNLETFHRDDALEGPRLERVLGLALAMLMIGVITMVVYFMWEPFRQDKMAAAFTDRSIERGAVLFANAQSPQYNSTISLLCANCHGVDAGGGAATWVLASEAPGCVAGEAVTDELARTKPQCLPKQVSWQAPNLQLAALRYSRDQLTQIITYGRPGTPMPAWGVLSGRGALNEQSIDDLVNYLESVKTTPKKAKADASAAVPKVRTDAAKAVSDAQQSLTKAQAALGGLPSTATADQKTVAQKAVSDAQASLATATAWNKQVQAATDGQILFQNNCARCHTRGWSYYDPTDPNSPAPAPMGSGRFGPNLTDSDVDRQFPPPDGDTKLYDWIANGGKQLPDGSPAGVQAYQGYGLGGISSGRMPHFSDVLTKDQIEAIMAYERGL